MPGLMPYGQGRKAEPVVWPIIVVDTVERSIVQLVAAGGFEQSAGQRTPPARIKAQLVGVSGDLDHAEKGRQGPWPRQALTSCLIGPVAQARSAVVRSAFRPRRRVRKPPQCLIHAK